MESSYVESRQLPVTHPVKFPDQLDGFLAEHSNSTTNTENKIYRRNQRSGKGLATTHSLSRQDSY